MRIRRCQGRAGSLFRAAVAVSDARAESEYALLPDVDANLDNRDANPKTGGGT
jgi:hypothetical protein